MPNRLGTANLYGSARLGSQHPESLVYHRLPNQGPADLSAGSKRYELTNHLGNVLSTLSDLLTPVDTDNNTTTDHFAAIVHQQQAYYPFGMLMPGLEYTPPGERNTRYSFNGKEDDKEVEGQQDYGFRIYDNRLGRFKSIDPLFRSYPFYSPYQFAGSMPIAAVDLDGLEIYFAANGNYIGKWGTSTEIKVIDNDRVQGFQTDLKAANNNSNDWIKQDVMNFYWSGAAGSRSPSTADKNAISKGHVIPTSTHESYSTHGDCYKSACATLSNNNYEPGSYWGDKDYQYQMYKAGNTPNVDIAETRLAGFEKINSELEAGRPLLIGVDYHSGNSNPNTDKTTDHFIVLTGRGFDNDGNLFYTGFENVDGGSNADGTSTTQNRFYPQADGTLQGGTTYTGGMTITQVRPVKEKK